MTDTRLISTGNIRIYWYLPNAFANWQRPTVAELNAGLNMGDAISWNDYSFGVTASSSNEDPAVTAISKTADRGPAQYGGSLSFYYPATYGDSTNKYAVVYTALSQPRTLGYLVVSIDGQLPVGAGAAVYSGGATQAFAAGDLVSVYGVETDSYTDVAVGEAAYRYTIKFQPTGNLWINSVTATATDTVVVSPATASKTVAGGPFALTATLNGRVYERGLIWTSSDLTKGVVSGTGTVTPLVAGTVTYTGTSAQTGASATSVITQT